MISDCYLGGFVMNNTIYVIIGILWFTLFFFMIINFIL
ncbi:hypothetical protein AM1_C0323 (plasmid) [Acaryochloris marina MBIC11017]|uniref:Uncharacterized protein n=1 Tax=Acaryochloris marina (strain MBIC 11017) TaxID=329726 RepID=A8ZN52_ACAM1|nr:hypothetical protein AM1_C0323 [Acaryochloris marina MBIC11017]